MGFLYKFTGDDPLKTGTEKPCLSALLDTSAGTAGAASGASAAAAAAPRAFRAPAASAGCAGFQNGAHCQKHGSGQHGQYNDVTHDSYLLEKLHMIDSKTA